MTTYLFTYDPLTTNVTTVHRLITTLPEMISWWHYVSGTYVFTSDATLEQLRVSINSKWPGGNYMIMEAHGQTNGNMPSESWDWLNKNVPRL